MPRYRYFEHAGEVLDRIDATDGQFGVTSAAAVADVAAALGVDPATVTVREADTPPTPTSTIPAPPEPDVPVVYNLRAISDAIQASSTFAEFKAALEG